MIYENADEVIKELFESLLNRYPIGLEMSMRGSDYIFDYVHLLYCKCHKINPNRGGSYIDSPDWIKSKKARINFINQKYNQRFQYAVISALNCKKIKNTLKK